MKKFFLSLLLSLVLVALVASMSFAAVTVGGSLRIWYVNEAASVDGMGAGSAGSGDISTFKLDRFCLDVNDDFTPTTGLKSEIQLRTISKETSSTGQALDIRLDVGYLYFKNQLVAGDEFDAGVFDQNPFKNTYTNVAFNGGLGDALRTSNIIGVTYGINNPLYDFTVAVFDSHLGWADDDPTFTSSSSGTTGSSSSEGLDYSLRVEAKPLSGLVVGGGYAYIVDGAYAASSGGYTSTSHLGDNGLNSPNQNNDNQWIIDASYNSNDFPLAGKIEYASVTPERNGVTYDALTGIYAEGDLTISKGLIAYVGRAVNTTSASAADVAAGLQSIFAITYRNLNDLVSSCTPYKINNNYNVVGLAYNLNPSTLLNLEYVMVDDGSDYAGNAISSERDFGLRVYTKF